MSHENNQAFKARQSCENDAEYCAQFVGKTREWAKQKHPSVLKVIEPTGGLMELSINPNRLTIYMNASNLVSRAELG